MDHLSELSRQIGLKTVVASLFCIWLLYWLAIGIYRVYFHPLSKIPGPKVQIPRFYQVKTSIMKLTTCSWQHSPSGTSSTMRSIRIGSSTSGRSNSYTKNMVNLHPHHLVRPSHNIDRTHHPYQPSAGSYPRCRLFRHHLRVRRQPQA
jgi:hypothetical protein